MILFVVDTREGLVPLDQEVAKRLRYVKCPMICVANKADDESLDAQADEFYRLGAASRCGSARMQNRNRAVLLDMIVERSAARRSADEPLEIGEPVMKVAIVGRRNVGKSTFVNTLAQAERMIVSEVPGTTRDSVDVRFELDGKAFMAIDTPGFRRTQEQSRPTSTSTARTAPSGASAGPTWCCCSSTPPQRISKVDKQLCDYIAEQYKPCIFVVNKWDLLAETMPTEKWVTLPARHVPHDVVRADRVHHRPDGQERQGAARTTRRCSSSSRGRGSTTGAAEQAWCATRWSRTRRRSHQQPPPKIYYATQVGVQPPTIVLFCNDPEAISQAVSALPAGRVPRRARLRRSADQALPPPPPPGRPARRRRCADWPSTRQGIEPRQEATGVAEEGAGRRLARLVGDDRRGDHADHYSPRPASR